MSIRTGMKRIAVLAIAFMMTFGAVFSASAGEVSALSSTLSGRQYTPSTGSAIINYMKTHTSQHCTVSVNAMLKSYYGVSTSSYADGLSAKYSKVYYKTRSTDTSKLKDGDILAFYTRSGSQCHVGIYIGGRIWHTGISSPRSQGCTLAWWMQNDYASYSWSAFRGFSWPDNTPPAKPGQVAIRLSNGKGNIIQVRWGLLPKHVSSYWVYRKNGEDGKWERVAVVGAKQGWANVKVDYNTKTYFKVRAVHEKKINGKLVRVFGRMSAIKSTTVKKVKPTPTPVTEPEQQTDQPEAAGQASASAADQVTAETEGAVQAQAEPADPAPADTEPDAEMTGQ